MYRAKSLILHNTKEGYIIHEGFDVDVIPFAEDNSDKVKEIDNETEEQFDSGEVLAETPKGKESPFDKR